MPEFSLNQNPGNPGDDYPPTRPGALVILVVLGLIAVGLGIENWSELSALAHSVQIERVLGL
jgi:hypothetical protein